MVGCAEHGDRGQDGASTRDEDEAEGQADDEPVPARRLAGGDTAEGTLEQLTELWDEERGAQHHEHRDPDPAQQPCRQAEEAEHLGPDQHQQGEARDEAGHDGEGATQTRIPPPRGKRGLVVVFGVVDRAGRTREQDDRQHRQDARRDPSDDAGQEGNKD